MLLPITLAALALVPARPAEPPAPARWVVAAEGNEARAAESKFTVDLRPLKSDQERRDRYVQNRTLETATYPSVVFVPRAAKGLPDRLPASGAVTFELTGDLTVKAVTAPVTWKVTMTVAGTTVTGRAVTEFSFEQFGMTKPRVASVLSVEETITLEYDFTLRGE